VDVTANPSQVGSLEDITVSQAIRVQGVTCEVQQLLGEGTIRCVAMEGTEGLRRGEDAEVLGGAHSGTSWKINIGPNILNVLGNPVDGMGDVTHGVEAFNPPPITSIRGLRYHTRYL